MQLAKKNSEKKDVIIQNSVFTKVYKCLQIFSTF